MIPAEFAPLLFSFCLSIIMSCVVSGVATLNAAGLADGFAALWLAACTGNRLVLPDDAFLCIIGGISFACLAWGKNGAASVIRTRDLTLTKGALYRWSYGSTDPWFTIGCNSLQESLKHAPKLILASETP